ncbi:MAG: 23S rRNA (uracil(1939)-C(5))-methyltransferase RlmD, partial [Firmicutes bacterium]|nr:23S rRNA (uracil(1939)-C(5))-methyltransferase RlmD [Bacillota bacterium]
MSGIRVGEEIVVSVEKVNHHGEGVGRYSGMVVFIPLAAPGDTVRAAVVEERKKFLRARLAEVIAPGETRCQPRCPFQSTCGGCSVQHMNYRHQLEYKTALVRESLARTGGLTGVNVLPAIGMAVPWHYRNKVRLHVARREGRVLLGLYSPASHTLGFTLGDGSFCRLVDEDLNELAVYTGRVLNQHRDALFAGADGLIVYITLRKAAGTGETMLVLGTRRDRWPGLDKLVADLAGSGRITTIVQQPASSGAEEETGRERVLYGAGTITDILDGLRFRLSAASFYQVNPAQTAVLYGKVIEYAALSGREQVVDAYCGAGTIALFLARRAGHVTGMEVSPAAVADARKNAALNGIANATFMEGAVEKVLPRRLGRDLRPDVLVLDPPRRGCHRRVLEVLAEHPVPRLVYVSCDPATLARDLGILAGNGYRVLEVQPVDM